MKKWRKLLKKSCLFVCFILVAFGFVRCNLISDIYDLGNETFDPYNHPLLLEGDTLVFRSQKSADSLLVNDSSVHDEFNETTGSKFKYYKCKIAQINCKDTCLNFELTINWEYYLVDYYYPFQDYYDPDITADTPERKKPKYSLQIGEIKLDNLYKIDFTLFAKDGLFIEITSALYSKTYGIVQYTSFTGEEFYISEGTLKMLMARE